LAGAFNAVLDRVDAALEQQHRFTADASHELRTPVAIIRSEAEVALDAAWRTPEEYRDALGVIRDGSEQLSRIVNDMFLLARSDAGQAAIGRAPIYLDELATDVVRSMSALAAARGIRLALNALDEVAYLGDEALLKRVLVNLLDNAIKHAPSGSVVTVALHTRSDGHALSVTDAGAGVPTAARALVFNRFFRADEARSRHDGGRGTGAGLGLSIAREIAELHGGRLWLHEPAAGTTTFELVLPLNPDLLR
ncbi:MAG: ATP-binding protein, partial [Gemmatimonas sp.]